MPPSRKRRAEQLKPKPEGSTRSAGGPGAPVRFALHGAPATTRTWDCRLGGGRDVHFTTGTLRATIGGRTRISRLPSGRADRWRHGGNALDPGVGPGARGFGGPGVHPARRAGAPGATRTRTPPIRSRAPYPLGHKGLRAPTRTRTWKADVRSVGCISNARSETGLVSSDAELNCGLRADNAASVPLEHRRVVGYRGLEPRPSCSQSRRPSKLGLYPSVRPRGIEPRLPG